MDRIGGGTGSASPSGATATARQAWWSAVRPATLAASAAPVMAGVAVAVRLGHVRPWAGLLALTVALLLQVGVNFANDYSDFVRGADDHRVGPLRAASSGVVNPRHVRTAALVAFAAAAAVGLVLSLLTDPRLLFVGALAVAAGWLYTGGPRPYGYMGLGEIFVFVFFGLFATVGTTYVVTGRADALAFIAGVATGALACAILVLNNLRDVDTDREAGKRTLVVRVGRSRGRGLLALLLVIPFAAGLIASQTARWALLTLLLVPLALIIWRRSHSRITPVLVAQLKATAMLELAWAGLFAIGVLAP